jgi:hypothetical protein
MRGRACCRAGFLAYALLLAQFVLGTGASVICETLLSVPRGGFAFDYTQADGAEVCDWTCTDGLVRCQFPTWEAWPPPEGWTGVEAAAPTNGWGVADSCAQLPDGGAVLVGTVSGVVGAGAAGAADALMQMLVQSEVLEVAFPASRPCWTWLRALPVGNVSKWVEITSPFYAVGSVPPVGQPWWAQLASLPAYEASAEDRTEDGFAEVEVLVWSNDNVTPLSFQAARLRKALSEGLGDAARSANVPRARWLIPPAPLSLDGAFVAVASTSVGLVLATMGCVLCRLRGNGRQSVDETPLLDPENGRETNPTGPAPPGADI